MIKSARMKILARWLAFNCPHPKIRMWLYRRSGIKIGKDAYVNVGVRFIDLNDAICLGERVAIAPGAIIIADSHANNSVLNAIYLPKKKPVIIEDDVWIGANVVVLPGVKIGCQSVIGAGAVVTKNVEPRSVVVGVPGRVIKLIDNAVITEK